MYQPFLRWWWGPSVRSATQFPSPLGLKPAYNPSTWQKHAETANSSPRFTRICFTIHSTIALFPVLFKDPPTPIPIPIPIPRIPSFSGTGIRSKIPGRCESQSAPRISRNSQLRCWRSTWRLPVVHRIRSTKHRGFYGIWRWCHYPYAPCMVYLPTFALKITQM